MNINFVQSENIKEYKPVLETLVEDFKYIFYSAILYWCRIIRDKDSEVEFWQIWLIKDDDEVVGICGLYSMRPDTEELWLGWFGVIPSRRKEGIGIKALDFLSNKAKGLNCKKILSYVNKDGVPLPFYEKYGFKVIGRVKDYLKTHPEKINEFEDEEDYIIEKEI